MNNADINQLFLASPLLDALRTIDTVRDQVALELEGPADGFLFRPAQAGELTEGLLLALVPESDEAEIEIAYDPQGIAASWTQRQLSAADCAHELRTQVLALVGQAFQTSTPRPSDRG